MGPEFTKRIIYIIYENKLNLLTPSEKYVEINSLDDEKLDEMVGSHDAEILRDDAEMVLGVYPDFKK